MAFGGDLVCLCLGYAVAIPGAVGVMTLFLPKKLNRIQPQSLKSFKGFGSLVLIKDFHGNPPAYHADDF
jgi:hypothetical protein